MNAAPQPVGKSGREPESWSVTEHNASISVFMASSGFGGAELHTDALASALHARGLRTQFVRSHAWPPTAVGGNYELVLRGLLEWQAAEDNLTNHSRIRSEAHELIAKSGADIVLCAGGWPDHNLPFIEAAVACNRPVLAIFHLAPTAFQLLPWQRKLLARLPERQVCLVAVSDHVAQSVCRAANLDRQRLIVVPNEAHGSAIQRTRTSSELRARLGLPLSDPVLLGVGRLVEQKGWRDFLAVALQIVPRQPRAHFVWVGDGPDLQDFKRFIRDHNLGRRVRAAGWQRELASWYASADLLLSTSYEEGDPLTIREASAAGLPVIATSGYDLVEQYPRFILRSPVGMPSALASLVQQLLSQPELLMNLRRSALQYRATSNPEGMHTTYMRLVRRLLAYRLLPTALADKAHKEQITA